MFHLKKNYLKPFYLFVFFLIFLCAPPAKTQEDASAETPAGIISSVEIIGLKRTNPRVARYPLEKFIGRDAATLDHNEVQAVVRDMGSLEPLAVEIAEAPEGPVLRVTVHEKWTIFPVPMAAISGGDYNFGVFLLDTNAFGILDTTVLGAMYGSSGLMTMAVYQHNPGREGFPGWSVFFQYGRRERKDLDRDEEVHRRYETDQLRASLGLQYPLGDLFSATLGISFSNTSLRENSGDLNPPEEGGALVGLSPGVSLRKSGWDGFLLSQKSLSVNYTYHLAFPGAPFHGAGFRGVFEHSLLPGFRLSLRTGGIWKSEADSGSAPLYEEGPGAAQVDILPRKFSARHYAGFSGGLEKYIFKASWGTLSALGSWQCVFSNGPISGREFDHGPSGGIRLYMSKLAMPAFGMGLAYNMSSGLVQFAVNVGMEY